MCHSVILMDSPLSLPAWRGLSSFARPDSRGRLSPHVYLAKGASSAPISLSQTEILLEVRLKKYIDLFRVSE